MVPPDSHGISRVPRYLGTKQPPYDGCADRAITFSGRLFQDRLASRHKEARSLLPPSVPPYNTDATTPTDLTSHRFRLIPFRSPLLRDSRLISFPRGTEMFHFPRFSPPCLLNSAGGSQGFPQEGCPIRISPDHGLFAPPRGLSQLTTSFIVFQHQGIHRMPFLA